MEAATLRDRIEKISGLTVRVAEVKSKAAVIGKKRLVALIVIDGTRELLKDGTNYRSSEANAFFATSARKIAGDLGLSLLSDKSNDGDAVRISRFTRPATLADYTTPYFGNYEYKLSFVVVVKINGSEIVVAQRAYDARTKTPTQ